MQNYKDINEIRKAWDNNEYFYDIVIPAKVREDHVFDEELSVKRNREMALAWNTNVANLQKEKMVKNAELSRKLTQDVIDYLRGAYGFSQQQAEIVQSYIYTEKHSFMCDYFSAIDDIASMVEHVLSAK
jgi:hypothetical protein